MSDEYSPSEEFKALRAELLQGRKYVFERPLLIITVAIAALNLIEEPYVSWLPPLLVGLLTFNLWFTVNRLQSLARIAAYIQLELEEKAHGPWLGWETCLRYYRQWTRLDSLKVTSTIDSRIDKEASSDAIGYYRPIYLMHMVVVIVAAAGSFVYTAMNLAVASVISAVATLFILLVFIRQAIKSRPGRIKSAIEENRAIWIGVFEDLQQRGIKQ